MSEHPISDLISTALQSIKEMIDVNTIVGEPVETADGTTIIPISRVAFGFGAGGSDFSSKKSQDKEKEKEGENFMFGGGSGAGVTINPVAFLVVNSDGVKLLPINSGEGAVDKLVSYIPDAFEKLNDLFSKCKKKKKSDDDEE